MEWVFPSASGKVKEVGKIFILYMGVIGASLLSVWIGHGLGIAVNDEISFYIKNDCMMIVKNYRSFIVNAITILTLRGEYRSNDKQCNVS